MKETKKEAFERISTNRISKVMAQLKLMKNFKNSSFYEYSNKDINVMCDSLINEVNSVRTVLLESKA